MSEPDIIKFLEEKAADAGIGGCRLVVENSAHYPCSVYLSPGTDKDRLLAGFGNTFDEAFEMLKKKLATQLTTAATR